jgi:hypothetical protein
MEQQNRNLTAQLQKGCCVVYATLGFSPFKLANMTSPFFHKTPQYWGYEEFFLAYRIYKQNEEEVPCFLISIFGFSKP